LQEAKLQAVATLHYSNDVQTSFSAIELTKHPDVEQKSAVARLLFSLEIRVEELERLTGSRLRLSLP
jgi:hypothetical protein